MDRTTLIKQTTIEVVAILLISGGLALGVNSLRSDGIGLTAPSEPRTETPAPSEGGAEIPLEEAIRRFEAGEALFVDSRLPSDYERGHIQGAVNLPEPEFDQRIEGFLSEVDPATPIITYCDGPHCDLGKDLAEKLRFTGYETVHYILDGWSRWKSAGFPTEADLS